ncbi:uncharacterized protein A1O9_12952 [Exophiala aquamarina CBS 119918]|uniref:Major facilitator superfamily (MFS) profile domain-containing protein n=1 Tax=Exophiala aquamarina CBS 119918 TaxID=1182545 RepID=A0A072NVB7_9EURO|nr:uncharacterized protein A1O9_12952 [Exophiala aquamarina CBS 119918]KEF50998.1 hypothetical protein A1O9_12952 [Exophiala aquamarina CBS 119918]
MCNAATSMVFGSYSDLFGRRWFIIFGNTIVFAGLIIAGAAKNTDTFLAACAISGLGGGLAQQSAWAVPELLPNRVRHIALVITEASTWTCVTLGPVAARLAFHEGAKWRWLFYGPAIGAGLNAAFLSWFYFPPKHPRGVPWDKAMKIIDYVGAALFTAGGILVLLGIVYTNLLPASNPRVVVLLSVGFAVIIAFALWERFMPMEAPLCPPKIFAKSWGREFTFPLLAATIINMFYYSTNIAYISQMNILYTDSYTPLSYALKLTLPQNMGMMCGQALLALTGSWIKWWRTQYFISTLWMVLFGTLLALGNQDNRGMMMSFAYLCQFGYGWSLTLSFAFIQLGVDQVELGVAGALAGVGRWTGGSIASSVYTTILTNSLTSESAKKIPAAAVSAGLSEQMIPVLFKALPNGLAAVQQVPGLSSVVAATIWKAWQDSYIIAIRNVCLASLGFGIVALVLVIPCRDLAPKMTPKIEVFLENDVNAAKNRFH